MPLSSLDTIVFMTFSFSLEDIFSFHFLRLFRHFTAAAFLRFHWWYYFRAAILLSFRYNYSSFIFISFFHCSTPYCRRHYNIQYIHYLLQRLPFSRHCLLPHIDIFVIFLLSFGFFRCLTYIIFSLRGEHRALSFSFSRPPLLFFSSTYLTYYSSFIFFSE